MKPSAFVRVCGVDVPIYVGNSRDNQNLDGAWGCYDPAGVEIWLDETTSERLVQEILVHEGLHALLHRSGALYELCAVFGLNRGDPRIDAWEEAFVRRLTPHVVETFGGICVISAGKPKKARTKDRPASKAKPEKSSQRASRSRRLGLRVSSRRAKAR